MEMIFHLSFSERGVVLGFLLIVGTLGALRVVNGCSDDSALIA